MKSWRAASVFLVLILLAILVLPIVQISTSPTQVRASSYTVSQYGAGTNASIRVPYQRSSFYTEGLYWTFDLMGGKFSFVTSSDNATWSTKTNIATESYAAEFDVFF
jgi:hypothetical protein